ncbi:MAG: hypothetical protein M0Q22_03440 [Sulfuritalea sp.]|jgi:hypothetical protein|nr:hypothetical protein [Sulfuritalea sp.]
MKSRLVITALVATSAVMSGCVAVPVQESHHDHVQVITLAPPPHLHENPGHPPAAGFVWISGYWNWSGVRYAWVSGRWEAPRHGYSWVPHRWERDGNQWRQRGGTWERETRHPSAPTPVPPPARQVEHRDDHRHVPAPEVRREADQPRKMEQKAVPNHATDQRWKAERDAASKRAVESRNAGSKTEPKRDAKADSKVESKDSRKHSAERKNAEPDARSKQAAEPKKPEPGVAPKQEPDTRKSSDSQGAR